MVINFNPLRKVRVKMIVELGDWPVKLGDELLLPEGPGVLNLIALGAMDDLGRVVFVHPKEEVTRG